MAAEVEDGKYVILEKEIVILERPDPNLFLKAIIVRETCSLVIIVFFNPKEDAQCE